MYLLICTYLRLILTSSRDVLVNTRLPLKLSASLLQLRWFNRVTGRILTGACKAARCLTSAHRTRALIGMSTSIAWTVCPTRPSVVFAGSPATQRRRPAFRVEPLLPRKHAGCTCEAAKGFAPSGSRGGKKNKRKLDANWIGVANLAEFPEDRPTKAVVLKDKSVVMLYNVDGDVYCSDANSTAFQYPLTHAKIVKGEAGPAVEVPLDGTIYDLETGKVLEWCPKNNLVRKVLGAIKSNQQPKKLKVYPAQVDDDGNVSVKFFTPST